MPKLAFISTYSALIKSVFIALILGFTITLSFGQIEQPPISNFTFEEHNGGTQNWMIDQSENGNIYVANNEGLLEYNGSRWRLYPTENQTLLRAVKAHQDRIYTGCYMDFGFWKTDDKGFLQYTSLTDSLSFEMIPDEQIWNILQSDEWIIFQSLDRIFLYNIESNQVDFLDFKGKVVKTFLIDDQIYFQSTERGLYKVEEGQPVLLSDAPLVKNSLIVQLYRNDENLMGITNEGTLLTISSQEVASQKLQLDEGTAIYSSIMLKSGHVALGTIAHGVIVLDRSGALATDYAMADGLNDNTVLSIFEDDDENIWAGLNNGVSAIYRKSGLKRAVFDGSSIGAVYASQLMDGTLYLGTNQGLYYRDINSQGSKYQLVSGIKEQVWSLIEADGHLLCGHNEGLFVVKGQRVIQKIANPMGVWNIRKCPKGNDLYLLGAYTGLYILEKNEDNWSIRNEVADFGISAKYFEWIDANEVVVSHEYKGIYHVELDSDYGKATTVELDQEVSKGRHAGLAKLGNDIYYSKSGGVWKYDADAGKFKQHDELSLLQSPDQFISGKMITTGQKLWIFSQHNIYEISKNSIDGTEQATSIALPFQFRSSKRGYEHINHLEDSNYLLGSADGYSIINQDLSFDDMAADFRIDHIVINANKSTEKRNAVLNHDGEFDHNTSSIALHLASSIKDPLHKPNYEYSLNGSPWRKSDHSSSISLGELKPNSYEVMIRNANVPRSTSTYRFSILKPWYNTLMAQIGFLVLGLGLIALINQAYTQYYKRQQQKLIQQNERQLEVQELESQQAIAKVENARLQSDIESKNRELGISTMHTIKQNELLGHIKNKLESVKAVGDISSVIKIIDQNLDAKSDWSLFEKAFNEADSDFFKKVKVEHPSLTPSDLKLCAYLRLNLSSKEIAPLLNISPRSVEIKRYRLRKKLGLSHEKDLVEYILEV